MDLTPKDFNKDKPWMLQDLKCSMILFYSDTCPYCIAIEDIWKDLGHTLVNIKVGRLNIKQYPDFRDAINKNTASPFDIKYVPTIIGYNKKGVAGKFESDRTLENLIEHAMCLPGCKSDDKDCKDKWSLKE